MSDLLQSLQDAVTQQASDIFIIAGGAMSAKVDGRIYPLREARLLPPETEAMVTEIYHLANRSMEKYLRTGDDDFSFSVPSLARFRVNAYRQRNSMAAVVRVVSFDIPNWQNIHILPQVMDIANLTSGMILFTGTAGSGKSTTQACIIDKINQTRDCHIITLEDPIEYLHRNNRSIISQREVAIDTADYLSALRACLRQAPDVILLGEMRDAETIRTAITAAETGHTVIATMHTKGAINAIDRVIDAFPAEQQSQIRFQLATVLRTVVSQQMLPDKTGNVIPVFEIMHINNAIRGMIRDNKNYQIENAILSGRKEGMVTMDTSILNLYQEGIISKETALTFADHPELLQKHL